MALHSLNATCKHLAIGDYKAVSMYCSRWHKSNWIIFKKS